MRPENGTRVRLTRIGSWPMDRRLEGVVGTVVDPISGLPGDPPDYLCGLLVDDDCARARGLHTGLHRSGKAAINVHRGDAFEILATSEPTAAETRP